MVDHSESRRQESRLKLNSSAGDAARGWKNPIEIRARRASVRGILCDECNKGLGFARENKTTLNRLADFLVGMQNEKVP